MKSENFTLLGNSQVSLPYFTYAGKRHETSRSKTEDSVLLTAQQAAWTHLERFFKITLHWFFFILNPTLVTQSSPCGCCNSIDLCHCWGILSVENLNLYNRLQTNLFFALKEEIIFYYAGHKQILLLIHRKCYMPQLVTF